METSFFQEIIDFVATEIAKFVSAHPCNEAGTAAKKKKLGFTLSHPIDNAMPFTNDPVELVACSFLSFIVS